MKPFYFAKRKLQLLPAAIILVALAISIPLSAQTITTFDAPGAGTGAFQGTYGLNINPSGTIIGFSRDANNVRHGFIRSTDGSFHHLRRAGCGHSNFPGDAGLCDITRVGPLRDIFIDSANAAHGYVRSDQGVITVFDAPGAGTGPFPEGTFPFNSPNSTSIRTGRSRDITMTRPRWVTVSAR